MWQHVMDAVSWCDTIATSKALTDITREAGDHVLDKIINYNNDDNNNKRIKILIKMIIKIIVIQLKQNFILQLVHNNMQMV